MTFLALTPLQTLLLAIVTAAVIIALYFLKLRHRKVVVSSSILWTRVLDEQQAHSLFEKLRKIISVALAVIIALLIAISLSRPQIESLTGKSERIVVVMDTSPTMLASTSDRRTRWQHALDEARAILDSGGATTEFRIADSSGNVATAFTTDRAEARRMLESMSPKAAEVEFPKLDATDSQVYFISDGVAVRDIPSYVQRVSVFENAANAGITAFEIRSVPAMPLSYEAYLEIQNSSDKPAKVDLTLLSAGGQRISRPLTLAVGQIYQELFDLSRFDGGPVRATIESQDDALPLDNMAFAYLPVKRKTRTLLVTRGNTYLEKLLKLDMYVDLLISSPADYREQPDVDAYIFDRFAPTTAPAKPSLIIGTPNAGWLRPSQGDIQKPEITTWMEDHPLMRYVSVHDVAIERAARIDPANLTVVAASNQTPLIVTSEKPRFVMLTFELASSDFPLHVGFPIFIENVLAWFNRDSLAIRESPGEVDVSLANAEVKAIDGKTITSQQQLGHTIFEASEPGLYTVSGSDNNVHIAVNLANRTFSDVNRSSFKDETVTLASPGLLRRELWFYMLLGAIVLIAAEWFTYHRRITL
jgi:hypothetical protein